MKKSLFLFLCLFCSMPGQAQMQIETIQLQGRPAAELVEILRPMVQQGGSISGTGYKLIIRSSPENIAQIKSLVADIDRTPQQLLISVSMGRQVAGQERQQTQRIKISGQNADVEVGQKSKTGDAGKVSIENDRIKYDAELFERRNQQTTPAVQKVRVTEGLWASIGAGQAIPVRTRQINVDGTVTETLTYQPVTTGFQVKPRVNDGNVMLSIRPQRQSTSNSKYGAYNTTQLETTVAGKLGQWIALGHIVNQVSASGQSILSESARQNTSTDQIWVKVERVEK
jgi:type II secretory pathway component GspD/PulD (secretin)